MLDQLTPEEFDERIAYELICQEEQKKAFDKARSPNKQQVNVNDPDFVTKVFPQVLKHGASR